MALTPAPGWQLDPSNPNKVIPISAASTAGANSIIPTALPPSTSTPVNYNIPVASAPAAPLNVPPPSVPTDYSTSASSSLDTLLAGLNAQLPQEKTQNDLTSQITSIMAGLETEATRRTELEASQGLPQQQKSLQDVVNQLQELQKESLALKAYDPTKDLANFGGRGITTGGIQPAILEQAERVRQNAVKSLGLAAIGQTLQGNISLAEQTVQKALDAEFEPKRLRLETLKQLYDFNKDDLERADKKRADMSNIMLRERDRVLKVQETNKNEIYKVGQIAAQYGADGSTVQKIFNSKSREEAMVNAGKFLQDPKAKFDLQKAQYDAEKSRLELSAFGKASGPVSITGDLIKDVASAITSNKVGASTKTALSAIMGVQGALEQVAKDNPEGAFKGISPLNKLLDIEVPFTDAKVFNLFGRDALMSKEGITSRAYINGINLKVQQWASGAALTEQQTKQVEQMTPKTSDTDRVVREKINVLYEFMNQQVRSALLSEGLDVPVPQNIDLWQKTDTLEAIFQ